MYIDPKSEGASRRKFLAQCGKFALVTPPTVTLMLTATDQSFAVAASGGAVGNVTGGGSSIASPPVGGGGGGSLASVSGGGGGGTSASFSSLGGGGGGSLSRGIPPECAGIKDPVEQAICVEEYAKGLKAKANVAPRGDAVESAALPGH